MFSVTHNMSKRKTVPVHQLLGFSHGLIFLFGGGGGAKSTIRPDWLSLLFKENSVKHGASKMLNTNPKPCQSNQIDFKKPPKIHVKTILCYFT